jgi:DNA-binding response OmpR family regulator
MTHTQDVRVLIVEDEALVSEIIRHALETAGYRVAGSAADGAEALEMARTLRPDVVLMDIDLPDGDGLEVTRRLLAVTPLAVVVLTAHETPELIERAGAVGVAAYLTKPPNVRELDRAIRISLARFGELQALRREKAALEVAGRPKVLFVDDDDLARQMYTLILRRAGYNVLAVSSAEAALKQLDEWQAGLIISDIMMPGLSGLDLLRKIQEQRRHCEVILITANANVETAVQALHEGAFDYLVKPVNNQKLVDSLTRASEALRRRWQPSAGPEAVTLPTPLAAPPAGSELSGTGTASFRVGPVVLDPGRLLITVNGQRVEATPTETQLFLYLCRNPNRVLTPQEMLREVRDLALEPAEAAELIRPHISSLRRKLLLFSAEADVIETVRSAGYRLKTLPGD